MNHVLEAGLVFAEAAEGAVMAGMMRSFVKDSVRQKIAHRNLALGAVRIFDLPDDPMPSQPTPNLRVARKQKDLFRIDELEGERETGVVRKIVQVKRKLLGHFEPVGVDAPPIRILLSLGIGVEVV